MKFDNLIGKQFRGLRTRHGKLIRNKVGSYERSRDSEPNLRREAMLSIVERETRDAVLAARSGHVSSFVSDGFRREDTDFDNEFAAANGDDFGSDMVVRYGADGKIICFHMPDNNHRFDRAYR